MTSGCCQKEYDRRTGRLLGNFPRGFSHVLLFNTAHKLDPAELRQQGQTRVPAGV